MIDTDVKLDILNECLAALGEAPLSSYDRVSSYSERWAKNRMTAAIDQVLELRAWMGSNSQEAINRLNGDADNGQYRYQLPHDCARVNWIRHLKDTDWQVERGVLFANSTASKLQISFNHKVPAVTWGGNLRELIGLKLALKIVKANENSNTSKGGLAQQYRAQLRTASSTEGSNRSGYIWREDLL